MFCKNCGTQIPDNSAHCPNCGAAQGTAPQQAAPMNPTGAPAQATPMNAAPNNGAPVNGMPAPATKAPVNFNADFSKTVKVGGKNVEFTLANILPMAMMVIILIAMIGIHSFTVGTFRQKGASKKSTAKYTYDYCIDELADDDDLLDDDAFTSFMKFFEVFTEIVAITGILGCLIFMNRDNIWAARCLVLSGLAMVLSYLFMIIFMFHIKGELKDVHDKKYKGGPTAIVWIVFALCVIVTIGGILAPMVLDKNKKKPAAMAPGAPAGGFGGFNG